MEKMWYYVKNGTDKHGPVPETELKTLAANGQVLPGDLVWSEGMPDWAPYASAPGLVSAQPTSTVQPAATAGGSGLSLGKSPYQQSASAPAATTPAAAAGATSAMPMATTMAMGSLPRSGGTYAVPEGLTGWLQFVGVMNIIGGVLTCLGGVLSIVTIIGPILYIPFGVIMIMAGTACTGARQAVFEMQQLDAATELFLSKIKRYMVMYGIMYIISLVLVVLGIIALVVMFVGMGMSLEDFQP
jgi:hypothetical protein